MSFNGPMCRRLAFSGLLALSLAACGGGSGGGAPTPTATQTPTPTPAPAPAASLPSIGTPQEVVQLMAPGINLGNTLESLNNWDPTPFTTSKETSWGNPMANQAIFDAYAAAGFKSVRIPVSWLQYTDASETIEPFWLARVKQVVDYARNANLYVIINIHNTAWLIPDNAHKAGADARLKSFWTQIADYFKDYDNHLLFAGTNEIHMPDVYTAPSAENCTVQSGFNQIFVDAVRATGGNNASRELIVQHYATDINIGLDVCHQATLPTDSATNRLMMEIHYYSPFSFTDYNGNLNTWQWGALATDPSAVNPCCNEAYVRQQLDRMKAAYVDKGVPVIMGEYGVGPKLSGPGMGIETYTNYWNSYVTHAAVTRGIVPIYWDSGNSQPPGGTIRINRTTGAIEANWLNAIMSGMTTDPEPASSVGVNGS